jgi:SAM-dependent methyltransferase
MKNLQINTDGLIQFNNEITVQDSNIAEEVFSNLRYHDNGSFITTLQSEDYLIEAFDEPYVAHQIHYDKILNQWIIQLPLGHKEFIDPHSITLDEWDRFHGYTLKKLPFVLSREAQEIFFNLLKDYTDDTITLPTGETLEVQDYWNDFQDVEQESFWSSIYVNEQPRWDLGQPTPALKDMIAKIKLPPSRIAVLGGGKGHDAAYLANLGHFVTLVDISPEAIKEAKNLYGNISNLHFLESDIFDLPKKLFGQFDVLVEHTCYCAINPTLRSDLVKVWRNLLLEGGHLLGVFFAMEKKNGPPFGGTEWELKSRLKKGFRVLYWHRNQNSIDRREGKEFIIYAQKTEILTSKGLS